MTAKIAHRTAVKQFEKWAKDHLGQGYSLAREEGDYLNPVTRLAFHAYTAGSNDERARIAERQTGWERGGKRHILDTYAKLHEGKLGMHWIWAAIERMVWAGESELHTMEDFGYVPDKPQPLRSSAEKGQP